MTVSLFVCLCVRQCLCVVCEILDTSFYKSYFILGEEED